MGTDGFGWTDDGGSSGAASTGAPSAGLGAGSSGGASGGASGGSDSDGQDSDGMIPKFDVSPDPADDPCGPGPMMTENDFSIIWIANTTEGTVSKIDTRGLDELGRFRTGPDAPDPSRTSVNLQGNVAVANRAGSVTMIARDQGDCVDANGNGTIDTASNGTAMAWGEDECVLWTHEVGFSGSSGNQGGPRAVAWDAHEEMEGECWVPAPRVWVGWRDQPNTVAKIRRLNGATGEVDDEVEIPDWNGNWGHGTYGGAIDGHDNFWALGTAGTLVRVDGETFEADRYDGAGRVVYGFALDAEGTPWLGAWDGHLLSFDRTTETFVDHGQVASRLRGVAIDTNGHAWIAANNACGLVRYDTVNDTLVSADITLPGCDNPVGVSIDVDGYAWVVDREAEHAYKVNPGTYETTTFDDLVFPYTYSDMTGAGLGLVVNPPS